MRRLSGEVRACALSQPLPRAMLASGELGKVCSERGSMQYGRPESNIAKSLPSTS